MNDAQKMAERKGFEPSKELLPYSLSRTAAIDKYLIKQCLRMYRFSIFSICSLILNKTVFKLNRKELV